MAATFAHKQSVISCIRRYYKGDTDMYNELTQEEHALQAACLAASSGADEATVVAALLHDVGWKLCKAAPKGGIDDLYDKQPERGSVAEQLGILAFCGNSGAGEEALRAQHDVIGATWLRMQGFDEKVAHLVEGHVLAKRYLVAKEPDYFAKLSADSVRTLKFQGGPMDAQEVAAFEADPLFDDCIQMRRWDESAKEVGKDVPDLESYLPAVRRCILAAPSPPHHGTTFKREGNRIVSLSSMTSSLVSSSSSITAAKIAKTVGDGACVPSAKRAKAQE